MVSPPVSQEGARDGHPSGLQYGQMNYGGHVMFEEVSLDSWTEQKGMAKI